MVPLSVFESMIKLFERQLEEAHSDKEEWRSRVPLQLTHQSQKRSRGGWLLAVTAALTLGGLAWYFYPTIAGL